MGTFGGLLSGGHDRQDYRLVIRDLRWQAGKHENGKRLPNYKEIPSSFYPDPIWFRARDVVDAQNIANRKFDRYPMHAVMELRDAGGGLVARRNNLGD